MSTLLMEISSLFDTPKRSDVTIKCGNTEWQAHSLILSARSTFFDAALSHDWKEAKTGVIDLPEDDPKLVDAMLQYIYKESYLPPTHTGGITRSLLDLDFHIQVGLVGDKYGVQGLVHQAKHNIEFYVKHYKL